MNSVLAFHEVTDPAWFDNVIQLLGSMYRLLPASDLEVLFTSDRVPNACHITVDDGHRTFYDVIAPILKRRGAYATLFVSPRACAEGRNFWFQDVRGLDATRVRQAAADMLRVPPQRLMPFSVESVCKALSIGQLDEVLRTCRAATRTLHDAPQNITVTELRELQRSGFVTVGAHTVSHPILKNEDDEQSRRQIAQSVHELAALLERDVTLFAYPNGLPGIDFTEREEAYLAECGIRLAFSTESRHVHPDDHRMRVPRIQITDGESLDRIALKLRFAAGWNLLKKLRPDGEYAERKRLSRVLMSPSRESMTKTPSSGSNTGVMA